MIDEFKPLTTQEHMVMPTAANAVVTSAIIPKIMFAISQKKKKTV